MTKTKKVSTQAPSQLGAAGLEGLMQSLTLAILKGDKSHVAAMLDTIEGAARKALLLSGIPENDLARLHTSKAAHQEATRCGIQIADEMTLSPAGAVQPKTQLRREAAEALSSVLAIRRIFFQLPSDKWCAALNTTQSSGGNAVEVLHDELNKMFLRQREVEVTKARQKFTGRKPKALAAHTTALLDIWRPGYTADQTFGRLARDNRFEQIDNDTIKFRETRKMFKRAAFPQILSRLINRRGLTNSGKC